MKCAHDGCRASALKDDKYCFVHSMKPEIVKKRKSARSRGGSRGRLPRTDDISTIADVKKVLAETINELRAYGGDSVVSRGRAVGYLCSILANCIEKSDLEERIAKLEEMMANSVT